MDCAATRLRVLGQTVVQVGMAAAGASNGTNSFPPSPATTRARIWNPRVEVVSTPATDALLTIIRAKSTGQEEYVRFADRLMNILAEEGLARFSVPANVQTPCGEISGSLPPKGSDLCIVDIMRSGGILLEAVRRLIPDSKTAKVLIQRDEETALPNLLYSKLPPGVGQLAGVVRCDPMLATGGSAITAIKVLKDAGVKEERILFLNTVSCPEGLQAMRDACPEVRIVTAAVDEGLNDRKFIVPGIGDFGDRYYGTFGYHEGLWGCT